MAAAHNIVEIKGLHDRTSGTAPAAVMSVLRSAKDGAIVWFLNSALRSFKQERAALAPGAVICPEKTWARTRAMLGVTAAPVVGSFVAFTVVQRAVIGQGVDPVGVTSVLAPAAALVVPNLAFMASRGGIKVNPFLVGTAYATVVAEIYRQLGTRSYKYNMGRKNGL